MNSDIDDTSKNLLTASNFFAKYGDKVEGYLSVSSLRLDIPNHQCAEAGEVFGKDGWTRSFSFGKYWDWKKTVDGISITIDNAEDNDINGSPVNPAAFPLMIHDSNESMSDSVEYAPVDDDIPF